jgi:mono/diheme cytochrome c family protein
MWWLFAFLIIPGDAQRGAQVFESQRCVACHAVQGKGGQSAPDLARRTGKAYTPSTMASLMWNHAPQMWSAMERASIPKPEISEQQAADLFAFFYAFRYFESPGDAARGRQVFTAKKCAECHATDGASAAPPVTAWRSTGDPIELARAMWNHAPKMREEFAKRKLDWPSLTGQDLTDLIVYARNLPGAKPAPPQFSPASPETGETLFQVKGCAACHKGDLDLSKGRLRVRTTADLAVALWNHAPKMVQLPPDMTEGEMRRLVGYLWSIQYFESPGNPTRGAKVYAARKCGNCHGDQSWGAPPLSGKNKKLDSITMVAALWRHGPEMLAKMKEKKLSWPRLQNSDMADLLAYVNSLP